MLNPPKKSCRSCTERPPHTGRRDCLFCIKKKAKDLAKVSQAKERAQSRINIRMQGVDEEDRDSLREKIKETVGPFLKNRQIQIKVSKGKTTSERGKLTKELDRVFSIYIRNRDNSICVVCGSREYPNNGHLFSRANLSTRWDEVNCSCQCSKCNILHENDSKPYTDWFILNYGQHMYDDLRDRWHGKPFKVTNDWIGEKIAYYRSKI